MIQGSGAANLARLSARSLPAWPMIHSNVVGAVRSCIAFLAREQTQSNGELCAGRFLGLAQRFFPLFIFAIAAVESEYIVSGMSFGVSPSAAAITIASPRVDEVGIA